MLISRYLLLLTFVFGLGCSAASAGQPGLFAGLFTLFAAFLAACSDGNKFSVTPGDETDPVTDTTDVTAPTELTEPTEVTEPTSGPNGPGYGLLRAIQTAGSFAAIPPVVGADFNGDGVGDVAVQKGDGSAIYVVFGGAGNVQVESLGTGGFQINGAFATSGQFAAGDINGDGKDDLIVRNGANNTLHVVFGAASASTVSAATPGARGFNISASIGSGLGAPTIGDFNGDGKDDVVIVRNGGYGADVVFGKATTNDITSSGLPQYQGFYIYDVSGLHQGGTNSDGVVAGDFNGDGKDDFVLRNTGNTSMYVIFGATDHTMVMSASPGADGYVITGNLDDISPGQNEHVVADVNGDGKDDLVLPGRKGDRSTVLFGGGAADVDLNGVFDGFRIQGDLFPQDGYSVYSNQQLPVTTASGGPYGTMYFYVDQKYYGDFYQYSNNPVLAADFDGDGKDDLVIGGKDNAVADRTYIIFGRTATTPVDTSSLGTGGIRISGDMVKKDLAKNTVQHPYYNSGYGKYYYIQYAYGTQTSWAHKAAGDIDGDGKLDLGIVSADRKGMGILGRALTGSSLSFAGAGTDTVVPTGTVAHDAAIADVTGDGLDDLVVRSYSATIYVFGQLPEEP